MTPARALRTSDAVAHLAARVLTLELATYPKPGLVSLHDSGSHADMDATTFRAAIAAIAPIFGELAAAGRTGLPMRDLRRIGLRGEARMLAATGGINTHRGAIFGLGLLSAAAGACPGAGPGDLGAWVRRTHGDAIRAAPVPAHTPGARARRRHGTGGAPAEASSGFPTLYGVGLPALRRARAHGTAAARVESVFALIATLEDTNLLHRGGAAGARFARHTAHAFLDAGGVAAPDWEHRAQAAHRAFVARRLSPGGAADLLAMTLFVDAWEAEP